MSEIPDRLGAYEIRGKLGSGGMGVVYQGWDSRLNRHVALKTLWPELAVEAEARERFIREARAAAAVSHPNITQIYDIGEEGGDVFFAMEYLEGMSLEQLLRERGKLEPKEALGLIKQAATGLHAAAERGIIHRDVKPSNLVLSPEGVLKVTDFGLAKPMSGDSNLTTAGLVIGTPHYISPEQARGEATDVRSDVYSLGATFYQMITGAPPFEGTTPVAVLLKHVQEPLPSPHNACPDLPYAYLRLLQRMMAKKPEDRPQSHGALVEEIERVLNARPRPQPQAEPAVQTAGEPLPGSKKGKTGFIIPLALVLLTSAVLWGIFKPGEGDGQAALSGPGTVKVDFTEPVSTPTPSASTRPVQDAPPTIGAGRRADLEIIDRDHEIAADGRLRVSGRVVNSGSRRATGSKVKIVITGENGLMLHTAEIPLRPPLVAPGQAASFETFFPDPGASVHIGLELSWMS